MFESANFDHPYGQNIHRRGFLEKQQRCYCRECALQAALTSKSPIFS